MRDSFLLLYGGALPKPLTNEQARLRGIALECVDQLIFRGTSPAIAINDVCDVLEPSVRGFAKWQYGDALIG
jgi:hypothetical protein